MKVADPRQPVEFVPDSELDKPEEERVVYLLKVPTYYEKIDLARAVLARNGRQHSVDDLKRALRRALTRLHAPDSPPAEQEELIDLWEAAHLAFLRRVGSGELHTRTDEAREAFMAAFAETQAVDDALAPLADLLAEAEPRYAQMRADNDVYQAIFAGEAGRKFVAGWRGLDVAFERGVTGVPLELLDRLPAGHLRAVARRISELMQPTPAEAKNFDSPSPGPSAVTTSATATTPRRTRRSKTIPGT